MLNHVLAVFNAKGGVGKTSVTSNIAGLLAEEANWRILVVDLDQQTDTGSDLGYAYVEDKLTDDGRTLLDAITTGVPIATVPLPDEHGVDVIPGGTNLANLNRILGGQYSFEGVADYDLHGRRLEHALSVLAPQYDLIILDCPPEKRSPINYEALGCAHWLLAPTKPDAASIEALGLVWRETDVVQKSNPDLDVIGVVLFDIEAQATRVYAEATAAVNKLGKAAGWRDPVAFRTAIRHTTKASTDLRALGLLAHHYASRADGQPAFIDGPDGGKRIPNPNRPSGAAGGLAGDYVGLVEELLGRMEDGS